MKTYTDREKRIWITALAALLTALGGGVLVALKISSVGFLLVVVGAAIGLGAAFAQIAQRLRPPDDHTNE